MQWAREAIWGVILTVVCTGMLFAADQRIDFRVQQAITNFQVQELERRLDFYTTKEALAPEAMTPDDRVNQEVLKRQLKSLR